ncbi:hypothetical protein P4O66_021130, partial [Electrophorus voltai]
MCWWSSYLHGVLTTVEQVIQRLELRLFLLQGSEFRQGSWVKKLRRVSGTVDKALQRKNGHLDLFLHFLLGLSLESSQTLLQAQTLCLLTQTGSSSHSKEKTVKYIKKKIRKNPSPEKSISLFHCLNEMNDHSLVHEVQMYMIRGGYYHLDGVRLSPALWSAVVFVLLNSEEELDVFDLGKYDPSEECLLRLLRVVTVSRKS